MLPPAILLLLFFFSSVHVMLRTSCRSCRAKQHFITLLVLSTSLPPSMLLRVFSTGKKNNRLTRRPVFAKDDSSSSSPSSSSSVSNVAAREGGGRENFKTKSRIVASQTTIPVQSRLLFNHVLDTNEGGKREESIGGNEHVREIAAIQAEIDS